jgi:hypothetical protein
MKSGDQAWSANEEATTGGLMEKVTVGPFTNVKVSIYSDDATLFFLSWEHDDARYHVWIDRHTYTIESDPNYKRRPTLYKNPPHGVRVGMDGYFRLRKLDARKHGIVDTCSPTLSAPDCSRPPSPRSKHANANKPTRKLPRLRSSASRRPGRR